MKKKQNVGTLEDLKDKFGKDLDIHVFNSPDGKSVNKYFSPTKFPKLKLKRNNSEYSVDVNFSSVEEENKQLLHELLTKTREKI